MSTSRVPVEIWEKILKYTISVPLFFDADPISSYGVERLPHYYDDAHYWRSEWIRKKMRCVCSSWNQFMRTYRYRYVRLDDIYHGWIPLSVIPLVIRLNLESYYKCHCDKCEEAMDLDYIPEQMVEMLKTALDEKKLHSDKRIWRLEILHGAAPLERLDFQRLKAKAPRLSTVLLPHVTPVDWFDSDSNLQFIATNVSRLSISTQTGSSILSLPNLTTLYLIVKAETPEVPVWNLPALRHLSVYSSSSIYITDTLRQIGKNLLAFYWRGPLDPALEMQSMLWQELPCVRSIQIPYWGQLHPPRGHPVRSARIDIVTLGNLHKLRGLTTATIKSSLPKWGSPWDESSGEYLNYNVQMNTTWLSRLMPGCQVSQWIPEWYDGAGVRIMDSEGMTLEEYVLFLIRWYWKGGKARQRVWISKSTARLDLNFCETAL